MAVPGANFGGKRVGSNGLRVCIGHKHKYIVHDPSKHSHVIKNYL